jgi:hypothetical protein
MEISTSGHKFLHPLVVVLAIVSCGLLGTGNGTALAEVHGNKIRYESRHAYRECAKGMNEKGDPAQDNCNSLRDGSYTDNEHLWVGRVNVMWYYNEPGKPQSMPGFCDAPESQSGPFFTCSDPMENR